MENKPDPASRWASSSIVQEQYLLLKLHKPSLLYAICFGKFQKANLYNLKEFKVYIGEKKTQLVQVLHSGLGHDDELELFPIQPQFNLDRSNNMMHIPCVYIKIVPIANWKVSLMYFNIYFVKLIGTTDRALWKESKLAYSQYCKNQSVRMCLKYLRQSQYKQVYEDLVEQSDIRLEDELLSGLYTALVEQGDFSQVEALIESAHQRNLFDEYIKKCKYSPKWTRILGPPELDATPEMRGGHQMSIHCENQILYIFGGWNGKKELSDLWKFSIKESKWTLISPDTKLNGGPGGRSCHKMCLDPVHNKLYTIGRFVDFKESSGPEQFYSDFWCYSIDKNQWELISENTISQGGPCLVFDHQMCLDVENQILFVFGGKTLTFSEKEAYSGLYSFHIPTRTWTLLRNDQTPPDYRLGVSLKSRIGHCMCFYKPKRQLFIFGGQRYKDHLSDFLVYDVDTNVVHELARDTSRQRGPPPGFTQRITLDPFQNDLFILSGREHDSTSNTESVRNSFWRYNLDVRQWDCIYQNDNQDPSYWDKMRFVEPCPRFGHQISYDPHSQTHYLFGGNPGEPNNPYLRLDDFWVLRLNRMNGQELLFQIKFLIRKQQYLELCSSGKPIEVLQFLQTSLSEVTNHADPQASSQFRKLATHLCQAPFTQEELREQRTEIFEQLLDYFPDSIKQL